MLLISGMFRISDCGATMIGEKPLPNEAASSEDKTLAHIANSAKLPVDHWLADCALPILSV